MGPNRTIPAKALVPRLILGLLAVAAVPAAAGPASDGAPDYPDTASAGMVLPDLVVSGEAASPPAAGRVVLSSFRVDLEDAATAADLGFLLPSTRVGVNSRGESMLMIRGAPERHVQTFLDGIPLNLPWDERVDLGSIPVTGGLRLEGRRGLASLLEGPGVLAGSVRLEAAVPAPGPVSRMRAVLGEGGLTRLDASAGGDLGAWRVGGGFSWNDRDSWPLPAGGGDRFNSDLDQYAVLVRAGRPVGSGGRLNLLLTRWHEVRGVPPELHLGNAARFWRYPVRKRTLGGASLHLPLSHGGDWDLAAMVAADFFTQEIDPRGPDGWDAPLSPGQDYEYDKDRTGHAMLGATHWFSDTLRLTLQGNLRGTRHRETLSVGGPELVYAQYLLAVVTESEWRFAPGWTARLGAGWDHAATPDTGDKPGRGADDAEAWNLRLEKELGTGTGMYASASRRSRFPSLRELFSGALGKFVPNPDLEPERQDLLETGLTARAGAGNLTTALFLQNLHGGIEKEKLPDGSGRFMRVNRTRIRVRGWEIIGTLRPGSDLSFTLQHTFLWARVEDAEGNFTGRAEDRPDYLSLASARWGGDAGPGALVEAILTGPRWSADASGASDATGGLMRLPAAVTWNLRLSWGWTGAGRTTTAHLRIENLFDTEAWSQAGLPEPGRVVSVGLGLAL